MFDKRQLEKSTELILKVIKCTNAQQKIINDLKRSLQEYTEYIDQLIHEYENDNKSIDDKSS